MMKNSKLSKLLVAGVSVAMLASALAPMAFAEEASTVEAVETPVLTVKFVAPKLAGTFKAEDCEYGNNNAVIPDGAKYSNEYEIATVNVTKAHLEDSVAYPEFIDSKISGGFKDSWIEKSDSAQNVTTKDDDDIVIGADWDWSDFRTAVKANAAEAEQVFAVVYLKYDIKDYVAVKFTNEALGNVETSDDWSTYGSLGDTYEEAKAGVNVLPDSTIVLPELQIKAGFKQTGWNIKYQIKGDGAETTYAFAPDGTKDKNLFVGEKIDLSTLKSAMYAVDETDSQKLLSVITIVPVTEAISTSSSKLVIKTTNLEDKSGTTTVDLDDATVANYSDKVKFDALNKEVAEATVVVGAGQKDVTYTVPEVKTATKGYTFSHWIVSNISGVGPDTATNKYRVVLSADKSTAAEGTKIVDGVFNPADYKIENKTIATGEKVYTDLASGVNTVTLEPVFTVNKTADVVSYGDYKTPNDVGVKKITNGVVKTLGKSIGEELEFTSGLWYNTKDDTFAYYLPKNSAGKWELDTTVDGIADGVYFADGKQDTEAYGLKKVSGAAEDDKFFYLVSDGLYVDDYTGIWVDEDGSIYNLINGCTSDVPFTGIVEKDGWATSVKDSKVDDKANGFILYGETQYWFINGTCNLNETEAVREHTDGNFYYTVGAKIDFTFNGECNGHTFVNGVASK